MSASDWKGYLIQARKTKDDPWETFPMKYINETSYKTAPNQREEIKAYRNENTRDLTRVTAAGKKTEIAFETRENLHLKDKIKIQKFFTDNENNKSQRRITLRYWNEEDNEYKIGDFYRIDITFTIKKVSDTDIIYDKVAVDLIEY